MREVGIDGGVMIVSAHGKHGVAHDAVMRDKLIPHGEELRMQSEADGVLHILKGFGSRPNRRNIYALCHPLPIRYGENRPLVFEHKLRVHFSRFGRRCVRRACGSIR